MLDYILLCGAYIALAYFIRSSIYSRIQSFTDREHSFKFDSIMELVMYSLVMLITIIIFNGAVVPLLILVFIYNIIVPFIKHWYFTAKCFKLGRFRLIEDCKDVFFNHSNLVYISTKVNDIPLLTTIGDYGFKVYDLENNNITVSGNCSNKIEWSNSLNMIRKILADGYNVEEYDVVFFANFNIIEYM